MARMKHARQNRREFMHTTGVAAAAVVGAAFPAAPLAAAQTPLSGGRDPDLIVTNAKVYTMDTRSPRAEAFAVTSERFTAVGVSAASSA